ncbi:MAG: DUF1028 domain-containing protein [Gammaproteobacteria bacterium]|nr:DUF1028 domain-containing protein [Gammaproteobacteria bacterium]
MTLSIAAWDHASGQLGAAIASSSISVASRCLHWRSGVGIALSQNITDPRLGPRLLTLLQDGVDPRAAMDAVVASTACHDYRQLGVIDTQGQSALYTGAGALGCHATASGQHCIAAGNLLAHDAVPAAMIEAFENAAGSFASRVLDALVAGIDAGGEAGPVHSAGLLLGGDPSWPLAELRIDWADEPIRMLRDGWRVYEPQVDEYVMRAYRPDGAPAYGVPGDP